MKIYKKKTGIKSTVELDADYFRVKSVILVVEHSTSKKELQDGENLAERSYEIEITDDKEAKLLSIALYGGATEE